jgi:hypothetical protein
MDTRGYRYLFWTAALAAGCLAWLVVLGLIGISSSLGCDAPGCRTGEDYAWLGAVLSWLLGSLAMIALVAVGWVAGRRGAPVRRNTRRCPTACLTFLRRRSPAGVLPGWLNQVRRQAGLPQGVAPE